MKRSSWLFFLFLLGCQMLWVVRGYGATIYVGPSETSTSIQQGIDAAANYDTVIVRDGTYPGGINFNGKLITVKSENGPEKCIIDGEGANQGVTFASGENTQARLEGFTIMNCHSSDFGGGIACSSSSPTITNCTVSGNSADFEGGGIDCRSSSSPTITNCTISGNSSGYGGYGGGISSAWSSPTLSNCIITGNSAYFGGGVFSDGSSITITNCTISGNSATDGYGGGISFSGCCDAHPTITNCTISGNSANWGGGIWCAYSYILSITNCTITGNSAAEGGGIDSVQSTPTVINSILWNDSPQEIYVTPGFPGVPDVSYSDVKGGYTGLGNINSDPLFVNAAAADFHLAGGSPCIDRADNTQAPATDKDGTTRPQDGDYDGIAISDMGAYEYVANAFADIPSNYWAYDYIEKLLSSGITTGCGSGNYRPFDNVTRAQMAVFLERVKQGSDFAPPPASGIFEDVPIDYWAAGWIEQFYKDGITKGCNESPLMYCPDQPVTRAEMAIFLLRAEHGSFYLPPTAVGIFSDVSPGYWAAGWIEQLHTEGITTGCSDNPLMFCPDASATRAQAAAFLVRMFGL